jgi:putative transposase
VRRLLLRTIHDVALMIDRERNGREASPSAGIVDSQSVKAPAAKLRGYDAGKSAPRRRVSPMEEGSIQEVVDWSGS